MNSNYDRSKTMIRKTTKNYHPRADDPLLLIICRKQSMYQNKVNSSLVESHYLCIIVHRKYAYPADWSLILVVYP